MTILPSPIIAAAIAAGIAVFGFTALYFRLPLGRLSGMQRLYLSWLSGGIVWGILLVIHFFTSPPMTQALWDISCGMLIYISFAWCNYWTANLGGGFRIHMLLDLAKAGESASLDQWMARYGGGRGMHVFLEDRLRSVLLPTGIISRDGDVVKLTAGRGALFAWGAKVFAIVLVKRRHHA